MKQYTNLSTRRALDVGVLLQNQRKSSCQKLVSGIAPKWLRVHGISSFVIERVTEALEDHAESTLQRLRVVVLGHLVGVLDAVRLLDVSGAAVLGVQVDHVLTLLGRADQAAADGLLLEVHGKGVELKWSISGQADVYQLAALAQELLAEFDQAAVLAVDDDSVHTRVRLVEAATEFFDALLLRLFRIDEEGLVGLEVVCSLVCKLESLLAVVNGDDLAAHGLCVLHAEVAKTSNSDHGKPLSLFGLDGQERTVDGSTGAEERRCLIEGDALRHLGNDARIGLHVLRKATVERQAKHTRHVVTKLLALLARVTLAAEAVSVDGSDAVADFDAGLASVRAGLDNRADRLVRADETGLCALRLVDTLHHLQVGVAVASCSDLNENVVGPKICWYFDILDFVALLEVLDGGCAHLLRNAVARHDGNNMPQAE